MRKPREQSLKAGIQGYVTKNAEIEELENALIGASEYEGDAQKYAEYYCNEVFVKMQELRAIGDDMETETASDYWPYPTYGDLLFSV